jgi:hypothetical protein
MTVAVTVVWPLTVTVPPDGDTGVPPSGLIVVMHTLPVVDLTVFVTHTSACALSPIASHTENAAASSTRSRNRGMPTTYLDTS